MRRRWVVEEITEEAAPGVVSLRFPDGAMIECRLVPIEMAYEPVPVRRLQIVWTCSDQSTHEHRWRWAAWLCGRWQRLRISFIFLVIATLGAFLSLGALAWHWTGHRVPVHPLILYIAWIGCALWIAVMSLKDSRPWRP